MNANPCNAPFITEDYKKMLSQLKRIDEEGFLYEMTYTLNYNDPKLYDIFLRDLVAKTGCSAFTTYNEDGNFILARNYDYRHPDNAGGFTGQNVIIHTHPEGGLASIGICDSFWLNPMAYFKGTLDDEATDISNLIFAPFACLDGMNEAGVSATLLSLDTKKGEAMTNQNTGKERTTCYVLVRFILDNAHNLDEAVEIARNYDIYSTANQDLHMAVADKNGNSAVLEWRCLDGTGPQELRVTYTNAVTNFFVGFDDGVDMYRADGSLRERLSTVTGTVNSYHYGYGHGYHRFCGIISAMERYFEDDAAPNSRGVINCKMSDAQAMRILSVAAQEPGVENTSMTQYSALFDMGAGKITLCSERDYSKRYIFEI